MKRELYNEKFKMTPEVETIMYDFNIPATEAARRLGIKVAHVRYKRGRLKGEKAKRGRNANQLAREYIENNGVFSPGRRRWTEDEIDLIMKSEMLDKELSELLGRSMRAIAIKRSRVRDEPVDYDAYIDPSKIKPDMRKELACAYIIVHSKEQTLNQLAKNLNLSVGSISNYKKELREKGLLERKKIGRLPKGVTNEQNRKND